MCGGDRAMLDAARHDQKFTGVDGDRMLFACFAVFHREAAVDDEEELIFAVMFVPDEFSGEFDELDVLAVELGDDFGRPMVCEF